MNKKFSLLLSVFLSLTGLCFGASSLPISLVIMPGFEMSATTGPWVMEIEHQGTNTKYQMPFSVKSEDEGRWGIQVSAPPLRSTDDKDTIQAALVNYKIYGGSMTAIPPQTSNIWLPLSPTPTTIYTSTEAYANFRFVVFVTPRNTQMQKVYKTKVTIGLVQR